MRKLTTILSLLVAFAAWCDFALAADKPQQMALILGGQSISNPAPPTACPMGSGFPDDGCTGAPITGAVQFPNAFQPGDYFNSTAATSANYMATNCGPSNNLLCRPPWNVAGVDYPVGAYSPHQASCTVDPAHWVSGNCLMDPQLYPPAGCTLAGTGIPGSPDSTLSCGLTGALFAGVIQHYDFGDVNGHNCTGLIVGNAGGVSTLLIDDIRYFNNSGTCATNRSGQQGWVIVTAAAGAFFPGGVTFSHSTLDFNGQQFGTVNGACAVGVHCNGWQVSMGSNPTVTKYNAYLNSAGDPWGGNFNVGVTPTGATYQFNFVSGYNTRVGNGHKEVYAGGVTIDPITNPSNTVDHLIFDHNTITNSYNTTNNGPGIFYLENKYGVVFAHGPEITNNTLVEAYVGQRPKAGLSFTGCLGDSFSGGACVAGTHNNILFVQTETHALGYAANVGCTADVPFFPAPGVTGYLVNNGGGYAAGSTSITIDSGSGTIAAGNFVTFPGDTNHYVVASATSTNLTINNPGLVLPVADNAAITVLITGDHNATGATYFLIPGPYPPGVFEEYGFDAADNNVAYYPVGVTGVFTQHCGGAGIVGAQEVSSSAGTLGHGATPYNNPIIKNNYLDIGSYAGTTAPTVWDLSSGALNPNPFNMTGSITGNVLTTTVSFTATHGWYINGAGIPGCAVGSIHTCPRTLNDTTGTNFVLDTTFGTPIPPTGTETMSFNAVNWCLTPAVVSGNQDMTHVIPDGPGQWLNKLSPGIGGIIAEGC